MRRRSLLASPDFSFYFSVIERIFGSIPTPTRRIFGRLPAKHKTI